MPKITLSNQLQIFYMDENPEGTTPILLLHGLGANCSSWGLQFPVLAGNGFRSLAPDVRGFGQSSNLSSWHRIRDMSNDVAELLTRLNLDPTHIVGISMGGVIALNLALDHPHLVNKLVLVDTFASLRPDRWKTWAYFTFRFFLILLVGLPAQAKTVAGHIFPDASQENLRKILYEQITQANPAGYRQTMLALGLYDVRKRLHSIPAKTLVITGGNDTTVPPQLQKQLVKNIPLARQVIILNAGHAVTIDQPAIFNQTLLDFLLKD